MSKSPEFPYRMIVPGGKSFNNGFHEDSDFVVTKGPTEVQVISGPVNGALNIQIVEDGVVLPEVFQYHQPVNKI